MVNIKEEAREKGEVTMAEAAEPVRAMLCADETGIVSRSLKSPEKMMSTMLRVSGLWGMMVSQSQMKIMCLLPKGAEECPFKVKAGGQVHRFVYLGWTVCEDGKSGKKRANLLGRAWGCYKLNGHPKRDCSKPKWLRPFCTSAQRGPC